MLNLDSEIEGALCGALFYFLRPPDQERQTCQTRKKVSREVQAVSPEIPQKAVKLPVIQRQITNPVASEVEGIVNQIIEHVKEGHYR
jgi:hypothetical protein